MLSVESFCLPKEKAAASVVCLERFEEAKAPWQHKENRGDTNVTECRKEDRREALLRLVTKPGVSSAAQRMALNILMKVESEHFDELLFSRILPSLVNTRAVTLLGWLLEKYFKRGDIRSHAVDIIGEFEDMMKDMKAGTQGAPTQKPTPEEAPHTHCSEQSQQTNFSPETADSRYSSNRTIYTSDRDSSLKGGEEEEELRMQNAGCKANLLMVQEPERQTCEEDFSMVISTAARVRDTEAHNSVKTAPRKKGGDEDDEEDEVDEEEEQEEEGGDSGEDEDEPEQAGGGGGGGGGGNEEDEEGEEEEEENQVDEEEGEDEDEGEQQRTLLNTLNNINNNNNNNAGGEFDEEDEENDGRVEDDDEDEGDDDDDPDVEDDEAAAPPKKKMKK